MGIKKIDLMHRIIDLEIININYEELINDLDKRLKKLEKPTVKKTRKVVKKG